jgi:hypothetical protein
MEAIAGQEVTVLFNRKLAKENLKTFLIYRKSRWQEAQSTIETINQI